MFRSSALCCGRTMKTISLKQRRITQLSRIKDALPRRPSKAPRNGRAAELLIGVKNILLPTDFSERSADALAYAQNIAELTGAKVTLMNVVQPVAVPLPLTSFAIENDRLTAATDKRLKELAAEHGIAPKLLDRVVVSEGAPWNEIVRAARNLKCDLIVIATQGHTGVAHAFLGSTAERVIRHADCPVLVVR